MKASESLAAITAEQWRPLQAPHFPFSDYAYLHALEVSGAVSPPTGWEPCYLTCFEGETPVGAVVLYAKTHSYGEYIFDWAWAQAYAAHRVEYYPKFSGAIPFTPATGPKLLFAPGVDQAKVARSLLEEAKRLAVVRGMSSLHFLFLTPEEVPHFEANGFLVRDSFQFHWKNNHYRSFDDFLAALKPRKRKAIVHEREELKKAGLRIETVTGEGLTPELAAFFHECYLTTIHKMGAIPYMNLPFFEKVFATMRNEVVLEVAWRGTQKIAAALFYQKGQALFGRYWGALEDVKHLHFELCYYRGIQRAIDQGLTLFEAGAQGEHKIARGFLPQVTYSAHWIRHDAFRSAIINFIAEERAAIANFFAGVKSPFA